MNWSEILLEIDAQNELEKFTLVLNQKKCYTFQTPAIKFSIVYVSEGDYLNPVHYHKVKGDMFNITLNEQGMALAKQYIVFHLESFMKEKDFYLNSENKNIAYFSYEFMRAMYFSSEALSGLGHLWRAIKKVYLAVLEGGANLDGALIINNRTELEDFIHEKFPIYTTSFESLEDLLKAYPD